MLYLRQSAYREESISLESQEHIAREYAERQGYEVVGVHQDGVSGRTWHRPGVQAAMEALETRSADVIVLWRWSRLSRSRKDWAIAADRADLAGGRIESATEPNDATAAGRFGRGIMVELAAFESERIGEQWTEVHEHRVRQGVPPTGGPRFGYARDADGLYVPDPASAPMLADLYARYLGGYGWHQLTRMLNDAGFRTRSNRTYTYQHLQGLLDSGFGAGLLGRTKPKLLPPWQRDYRPGIHEPVIDRDTWEAYVALRAERYRKPVRSGTDYLLTGIARCGHCGSPMSGKRFDGRPTYICSRSQIRTDVRRVTMVAWRVDAALTEWLFALSGDIAAHRNAQVQQRQQDRRRAATVDSLHADLQRADDRLAALTVRLADDIISDDAYKLAAAKIHAERDAANARIRMLAANPVRQRAAAELPRDLEQLWPHMTKAERVLIIRSVVKEITVAPADHRGQVEGRLTIVPAWED